MKTGLVFKRGWTLDDVQWSKFDASKVTPTFLAAAKAASLVEYNAPDYVDYLKRVLRGAQPEVFELLDQWQVEEVQHGAALGRWAEMADPTFNFEDAVARFRTAYKPQHFASGDATSIRGSRRGEVITRCVVECGTSSYYSAIRDLCEEPVLQEIAGRIAADEFRHYRLFLETLANETEAELPVWKKLWIAFTRINEADDDELAYAYYCANVSRADEAKIPYDRAKFARLYNRTATSFYRRPHIKKLVQMVAKACGARAQSWLTRAGTAVLWSALRRRAGNAAGV
ncbi:MAG: ferritin-like domain-containing protein [Alphaproteobacteria bacterium]|nr:ferritin-like domain-containing protein [Alphaproteobacteria bacterium]MDE2013087.1 ferritin-like domain-containing protein [Alphaproteobacteria bacterium]MDE2074693.1 ferritin-like domain-containing protein [Alphaproteobacteria bacterium]MDE2351316.1 ferritin-like domain-containing protein [Alphaproteobacteria bacterium]